ncbi:MAG: urate oxidase [Hymenobacter sp.]|nr:MAG: urate oxidase [Hymenobacter sp.]
MKHLVWLFALLSYSTLWSQDISGIWQGKLTQEPGGCFPEYYIELQIKKSNRDIEGVSYDYYDTSRFVKLNFTGTIEAFGLVLARHFVSRNAQVSKARIELVEHLWQRISFDGKEHAHAFTGGGSEKRRAVVELSANGTLTVWAGIKGLLLAKTTDSGFVGYPKDEYTTLPETTDRILSTECEAEWEYSRHEVNFEALFQHVRATLLRTFAGHKSLSVQHTLYAMGEQVLQTTEQVKEISFIMPNKHHIPFNLTPFGQENTNEIFVATDAPYGYITGTVVREA